MSCFLPVLTCAMFPDDHSEALTGPAPLLLTSIPQPADLYSGEGNAVIASVLGIALIFFGFLYKSRHNHIEYVEGENGFQMCCSPYSSRLICTEPLCPDSSHLISYSLLADLA